MHGPLGESTGNSLFRNFLKNVKNAWSVVEICSDGVCVSFFGKKKEVVNLFRRYLAEPGTLTTALNGQRDPPSSRLHWYEKL